MTELSREAREALTQGLSLDGPSPERRARVKARLAVALGGGAVVLGGTAAAAEIASPIVAGAAAGVAKGVAVGSLLVWFGVGAAAGVGVSGVLAMAEHHHVTSAVHAPAAVEFSPPGRAGADPRSVSLDPPLAATAPSAGVVPATAPSTQARLGANPPSGSDARFGAKALSGIDARSDAFGRSVATAPSVASAPPAASAPPVASSTSTLSEEAALLERAQRALAANQPNAALAVLAEHERSFPAGALREERQAARVLALCELGRTAEARALARAFVTHAPGSVLVPRLERSCAAPW